MQRFSTKKGSSLGLGGDLQFLKSMADILRSDSPAHCEALRNALADHDFARLQTTAHTLKGSLANVGGLRASSAAHAIEQLARQGNTDLIPAAITRLEGTIEELFAALDRLAEQG